MSLFLKRFLLLRRSAPWERGPVQKVKNWQELRPESFQRRYFSIIVRQLILSPGDDVNFIWRAAVMIW